MNTEGGWLVVVGCGGMKRRQWMRRRGGREGRTCLGSTEGGRAGGDEGSRCV